MVDTNEGKRKELKTKLEPYKRQSFTFLITKHVDVLNDR